VYGEFSDVKLFAKLPKRCAACGHVSSVVVLLTARKLDRCYGNCLFFMTFVSSDPWPEFTSSSSWPMDQFLGSWPRSFPSVRG